MAQLSLNITIPDEKEVAAIDALAYQNGYQDQVEDEGGELIPNPITKIQHIKAWILNVVRASYKTYNDRVAMNIASDNQTEDGSDFA